MDKRTKEAIRYLGYGKHVVDERTQALLVESFADLEKVASGKTIYRVFSLDKNNSGYYYIDHLELTSKNLTKNLENCKQIVLFASTLGIEVDRFMKRQSLLDMSKALIVQACAAAMLEEQCDKEQKELEHRLAEQKLYLRPRFSPGYGDFDIAYQEPILRILDCGKKIGLTMTDSFMLSPTKSVTAVIGISTEDKKCHMNGCEVCKKTDCSYRRDTV